MGGGYATARVKRNELLRKAFRGRGKLGVAKETGGIGTCYGKQGKLTEP